jgi:ubiquinone/menaquinone biosynthesis C-methylase UbiE
MTVADGSRGYERLTHLDIYRKLNIRLLELVNLRDGERVLDVGAGTGATMRLAREFADLAECWGLEPDEEMIEIARSVCGPTDTIVESRAEGIEEFFEPESIDVAIVANCVHLFDDAQPAFRGLNAVLVRGGRVGLSTSYFGAVPGPVEAAIYTRFLLDVRKLANHRVGRAAQAKRDRSRATRRELSMESYKSLLVDTGFRIAHVEETVVQLPTDFLLDLVGTPMFAEGVLPGLDPAIAGEIVRDVLSATIDRYPTGETLTRPWLYITAAKI